MESAAIHEAAILLAHARKSGVLIDRLPSHARPATAENAFAIQREIARLTEDKCVGFKAALHPQFGVLYAGLLRSRVFANGARIPSAQMNMIGVEAELAFRFHESLPPRPHPYDAEEVAAAVFVLPAIETLDTRYSDFDAVPAIEKAADFMSNGCFVEGIACQDWRSMDLKTIEVILTIDGKETIRKNGGHPSGDPLLPAIALANHLRLSTGLAAGTIVTTGTYTGTVFVSKTSTIEVRFAGMNLVSCQFH